MNTRSMLVGILLAGGMLSVSTIEANAQSNQDCWAQYGQRPDNHRDLILLRLSDGSCTDVSVQRYSRGHAGRQLSNGAVRYSDGSYVYPDSPNSFTIVQSDGSIRKWRDRQWQVIFDPNADGSVLMGSDVFEAEVRERNRQREETNRNKGSRGSDSGETASSSNGWLETLEKDPSVQNSDKWGNQSNANSAARTDKWGNSVSDEQGASSTNKWGNQSDANSTSSTDKWGNPVAGEQGESSTNKWGNTATSDSSSGTDKWGNPVSGGQGASSTNKWGDSPSSGASETVNKWGETSRESSDTGTDKFGNSPSNSQSESSGKWGDSNSSTGKDRSSETGNDSNSNKNNKGQ